MPDTFAQLRQALWDIKDGKTFREMAEAADLKEVTLWRVMKGQRQPSGQTLQKLLVAYPKLRPLFLPADSPDGKEPVPSGTQEVQA